MRLRRGELIRPFHDVWGGVGWWAGGVIRGEGVGRSAGHSDNDEAAAGNRNMGGAAMTAQRPICIR